jgi:hypothetical protein
MVVSFMIAIPFHLGATTLWAASHYFYERFCPDRTPTPGFLSNRPLIHAAVFAVLDVRNATLCETS